MSISSPAARRQGVSEFLGVATPAHVAIAIASFTALMIAVWPLGMTSDYLNHLARNYIEAYIWSDPDLQNFYALSFAVIPDLTMDLIVPWLSHVTGIYAAGAATIWLALVTPALAGMLIAKNLHGRVTWCCLAGFLVMFNENMQWGFVNFSATTGFALLGFAVWMKLSPNWTRVALCVPFSALLALNHALGFLLFGFLVLLWEFGCFFNGERRGARQFLGQLLTRDALSMLPGLLVIAFATGNAQELTHGVFIRFDLVQKIDALWSGADFFNPILGRVVTIIAISAVLIGLRRGILRIDPRMAWVCCGMLLLVLAMPTVVLGIWGLHFRYPAVLLILVAASLRVEHRFSARQAGQFAVVAATLMIAVFANAAVHLSSYDRQARELQGVVAELPQGARLLPARTEDADFSFALHSAAMAVIERSAFVPNLFTNTSPVDVHPQMLDLHMPQAWPLLKRDLVQHRDAQLPASENGHWSPHYYHGWPNHWDYVLYFRTKDDQRLDIASLCPIAEQTGFVLYRISRGSCEKDNAFDNATLRSSLSN